MSLTTLLSALLTCAEPAIEPSDSALDTGLDTGLAVAAPTTALATLPSRSLAVRLDTIACQDDTLVVQTLGVPDHVDADGAPMDADPPDSASPWRTFRLVGACDAEVAVWLDGARVD